MGRIGGWFKKSDDKEKAAAPAASNPYAQQPPGGQQPPPPQYDQYTQYNDNRHTSQSSQGPPSGLPAGPRPGGLPSRVAPGPRMGAPGGDDKSPPPQYSPYDRGTPSLNSVGGTPVLSSNTPSPSMGTGGFPKEKYGAADGIGRNRFEPPAPSPYGNSAAPPQRSQGGYGNLDSGSGALFANYNGPQKQVPGPGQVQTDGSYGSMQYGEQQPMTEEEREQAEVDDYKAQIEQTQADANDVGRRNYARMVEANERMRAMNNQLLENSETLTRAEENTDKSKCQADVGGVNLDDLDAANTTIWNFAANSKTRIAQRAEKKMTIQKQHQMIQDQETRERRHELEREWEVERQAIQAAKPAGLLGGANKKQDFSRFEFEDDSGRQREMNEEYDGIVKGLEEQAEELHNNARFQTFILNNQLKQIERMTDKAQVAEDAVAKNQFRLDTKYNKR